MSTIDAAMFETPESPRNFANEPKALPHTQPVSNNHPQPFKSWGWLLETGCSPAVPTRWSRGLWRGLKDLRTRHVFRDTLSQFKCRQQEADLLSAIKFFTGKPDLTANLIYHQPPRPGLRGHTLKLSLPRFTRQRRKHFFTARVASTGRACLLM